MADSKKMSTEINSLALFTQRDFSQIESLWMKLHRLISSWARRYHDDLDTRLFDTGDLIQQAYFAMIDSVGAYVPERGDFLTLLRYNVRRQFAEVSGRRGKKLRPEVNAVSGDAPIGEDGDLTILDTLVDPRSDFADELIEEYSARQDAAALYAEAKKLPAKQRDALMMTVWGGLTLREAGVAMGLSIESVRRHRDNAADELRRSMRAGVRRYCNPHHVSLAEYRTSFISEPERFVGLG